MKNNYKIFILGILLSFGFVAHAAPTYIFEPSLLPQTTDTYYLGSTSPNLEWNGVYTKDLNVSGTCTGCGVPSIPFSVANGGTGASSFGQGWIFSSGGTGALGASTSPTVNYIIATSTTVASQLPYASTTALTVMGNQYLTPLGQGWLYTNGGTNPTSASTSPTINYLTATSTTQASQFPYASSTALTVSGTAFLPGTGIWNASGVGIGTVAPRKTLELVGTGAVEQITTGTSGADGYANRVDTMIFARSDVPTSFLNKIQNTWSGTPTSDTMSFQLAKDSSTYNAALILDGSGQAIFNNGTIGTGGGTDVVDFHATNSDGGVRIYAAPSLGTCPGGAALQFYSNTNPGSFPGQVFFDAGCLDAGALIFRSAPTSGTITERMRVTSTGLIGIGTTTPMSIFSINSNSSSVSPFTIATSTAATLFRIDAVGNELSSGDQPTVSCTPSGGTIAGDNTQGAITTGTLSTACTLTFQDGGYPAGGTMSCQVSDNSTSISFDVSALSNTAVTFSSASALTGTLYYRCGEHINK